MCLACLWGNIKYYVGAVLFALLIQATAMVGVPWKTKIVGIMLTICILCIIVGVFYIYYNRPKTREQISKMFTSTMSDDEISEIFHPKEKPAEELDAETTGDEEIEKPDPKKDEEKPGNLVILKN